MRIKEVKLTKRLVRKVFGPYKMPTDLDGTQMIEAQALALINAMPEQDESVEAVLPCALEGLSWRETVAILGWPDKHPSRVAKASALAMAILRVVLDPLKSDLIDIFGLPIERQTFTYDDVGDLLGLDDGILKARVQRMIVTDKVVALGMSRYMPRAPSLIDFLLLDGETAFQQYLSRLMESGGNLSTPGKKALRLFAKSDATEPSVMHSLGVTRQRFNQNKQEIFELIGLSDVRYLRRVFRFPAVHAWRAVIYGKPLDSIAGYLRLADEQFGELEALLGNAIASLDIPG